MLEQQPEFDQYHWQLAAPSSWQLATAVGKACQTCLLQAESVQVPLATLVTKMYSCHPQLQLASYVALKNLLTEPSFLEFDVEEEEVEEQEVGSVTHCQLAVYCSLSMLP